MSKREKNPSEAQDGQVLDRHMAGGAHARLVEPEDNFVALLKRYGWVIALVVVGIIGFVGYASYKSSAREKAGVAQYQAIANLNNDSQNGEALIVLQQMPTALSSMKQAQVALQNGDQEQALAIYQAMSGNDKFSLAMRDYAKLQMASLNNGAGVEALAAPGQPFIFEAKLLEADQLVAQGKNDEALIVFEALLANVQIPAERALVESMILALDGELPEPENAPENVPENLPAPIEGTGNGSNDGQDNNDTENGQ